MLNDTEESCLLEIKKKINYSGGSITTRVIDYFKEKFLINLTRNICEEVIIFILDYEEIFTWDYADSTDNSYCELLGFINTLERSLKIEILTEELI